METPLGRVTLVTGKEEFLNERTVQAVRAAVRAHDPEAELSETAASDLTPATLGELAAPVAVLLDQVRGGARARGPARRVGRRPARLRRGTRPRTSPWCSCTAAGCGAPASSTKLRKLAAVTEAKSVELKAWEVAGFVTAEVRSHGGRIDKEAAQALVSAVGTDLRSLAAAADQLSHDAGRRADHRGGREALLRRQGRGQVVRDRRRRLPRAQPGGPGGAALGDGDRGAARRSSPRLSPARPGGWPATARRPRTSARPTWPARSGVPPWKLKDIKAQAQGWTDHGLARAIRAVAQADADIKGAASDASYTLERLVLTIAGLRAAQAPK